MLLSMWDVLAALEQTFWHFLGALDISNFGGPLPVYSLWIFVRKECKMFATIIILWARGCAYGLVEWQNLKSEYSGEWWYVLFLQLNCRKQFFFPNNIFAYLHLMDKALVVVLYLHTYFSDMWMISHTLCGIVKITLYGVARVLM